MWLDTSCCLIFSLIFKLLTNSSIKLSSWNSWQIVLLSSHLKLLAISSISHTLSCRMLIVFCQWMALSVRLGNSMLLLIQDSYKNMHWIIVLSSFKEVLFILWPEIHALNVHILLRSLCSLHIFMIIAYYECLNQTRTVVSCHVMLLAVSHLAACWWKSDFLWSSDIPLTDTHT